MKYLYSRKNLCIYAFRKSISTLFLLAFLFSNLALFAETAFADSSVKKTYIPSQSAVVLGDSASVGEWSNPLNAFVVDLNESSDITEFMSENSVLFSLHTAPVTSPLQTAVPSGQNDYVDTSLEDVNVSSDTSTTLTEDSRVGSNDVPPQATDEENPTASQGQIETSVDIPDVVEQIVPSEEVGVPEPIGSLQKVRAQVYAVETIPFEQLFTAALEEIKSAENNSISSDSVPDSVVGDQPLSYVEYFGFINQDTREDLPEVTSGLLKLSFASQKISGSQLHIQYAVSNGSWSDVAVIDLSEEQSNDSRGDFLGVNLPVGALQDIEQTRIRFIVDTEAVHSPEGLRDASLYIDGLSLEVVYGGMNKLQPESLADGEQNTNFDSVNFENDLFTLEMPGDLSNPIIFSSRGLAEQPSLMMYIQGVGESAKAHKEGQRVTYENAYESTDLQYDLTQKGIKESIVLKDEGHPDKFEYTLNSNQYDYVQVSSNKIELYKKGHGGQELYKKYTLSAPYMIDAKGIESTNIDMVLSGNILEIIPDPTWLSTAVYPVVVDPTVEVSVLNIHSHPVAGEQWNVDFTTVGTGDLKITPADQATIDDDQFTSLFCGTEDRTASTTILEGDVLFYPDWSCDDVATVSHLTLVRGNHHLLFSFNGSEDTAHSEAFNDGGHSLTQAQYQFFNNADSSTPGSSLGSASATTTIYATTSPIRLRMNVQTDSSLLANSQRFKLQISTAELGGWQDVTTISDWWDGAYLNRKKIYFNNASSTDNLINFPVLVSLSTTSGTIDYTKTQNSGQDIRFVDPDGTSLNYQIERWDETATSSVWVKVPQINALSTTDYIWMYYNNSTATSNATTTGVWDSNYVGVWHLNETSGTSIADSTSFGSNGTKTSGAAHPIVDPNGYIGGAQLYDPCCGGGNIDLGTTTVFKALQVPMTISGWFKYTTGSGTKTIFGQYAGTTGGNMGKLLRIDGTSLTYFMSTAGGGFQNFSFPGSVSLNQWHYYSVVTGGTIASPTLSITLDGVTQNFTPAAFTPTLTTNYSIIIGASVAWPVFERFVGTIDETRIASTSRSASWVDAEYRSTAGRMNNFAAEETISPVGFYNNPSVTSSSTIASNLLPASNILGTYQEGNPSGTNPFSATAGQYTEYDWSINPSYLYLNTTYYFRMVESVGTAFTTYTSYPTLMLGVNNVPTVSTLGTSQYVDGSWGTDSTPTFTFTTSDADVLDTVQYQVQIATTSDFSGIVVDYTSALATPGASSFTVGQALGGGTYAVGSVSQTLTDSANYYWRVRVIDSVGQTSSYSTANSGSIAFKLDTAITSTGTLSLNGASVSTITANISGVSDSGIGLSLTPYIFYNTTLGTNSGATSSTSWISTGLSLNTNYSFVVAIRDLLGNVATTSAATLYTLANPPTTLATTSVSRTSIGLSWSANSNPGGTIYLIENVTNADSSGFIGTTGHLFGSLTCNTAYTFRVLARNGNSVNTAYSSSLIATTSACNTSPDTPTTLAPTAYVNGSWGTDNTPTLTFTQSDGDLSDTLRYHIQIDNNSDFSSPTVESFSSFIAQGGTSFTSSTLPDGQYYWRVRSFDGTATSSYATANGGAIAFGIDTTSPSVTPPGNGGGNGAPVGLISFTPVQPLPIQPITPENTPVIIPPVATPSPVSTPPRISPVVVEQPEPAIPTETNIPPVVATNQESEATSTVAIIIDNSSEIIETIGTITENVVRVVVSAGGIVNKTINNVLSNSVFIVTNATVNAKKIISFIDFDNVREVIKSNENVTRVGAIAMAPVALAAQYSVVSSNIVFNIKSGSDAVYATVSLFNGLLTALGIRKRRRRWGVVYDSLTKQPLDPVLVQLVDATTGKVVEESITDMLGRFGFIDRPGRYMIRATKTNYQFPSSFVKTPRDMLFANIYLGEEFTINLVGDVVTPNIPMDQLASDWNQIEKKRLGYGNANIHLDVLISKGLQVIFWGGFVFIGFVTLLNPNLINIIFSTVYVVLALISAYMPKPHLWGEIVSKKLDRVGLLVELRHESIPDVVIAKTMTKADGKFLLRVQPGEYILKVKSIGDSDVTLIKEEKVIVGSNGAVDKNIVLD